MFGNGLQNPLQMVIFQNIYLINFLEIKFYLITQA